MHELESIRYYINLLILCVFPSHYFLGTAIGTVISLVTSGLIADNQLVCTRNWISVNDKCLFLSEIATGVFFANKFKH